MNQTTEQPDVRNSNIRSLLDTLRAIAQEGLSYAQNEYDTARYEKLLDLASMQYAALTGLSKNKIRTMFLEEQGSITPKLGIDCAVLNSEGGLLMLQRNDGTWGMPAGWADVGESPFQTTVRESFEETGIKVTPKGYIGIAHKTPETHPGFVSQVNICVAIEPVSPDQKVTLSHEHQAYKWIRSADDINNWHIGQERFVRKALAAYKDNLLIPNID